MVAWEESMDSSWTSLRAWMEMQGGPFDPSWDGIEVSTASGPKTVRFPDGSTRETTGGAFEDVLAVLPSIPAPEEPAAQPGPFDALLDGTVKTVSAAILSGEHDADLDAIEAAETAGKTRKGVLEVIAERRAEIAPQG